MIAFLTIVYTLVVVLLFKLKILRPRPFPIACVVVAGILLMGGVVVAWFLCAPMSGHLVTTQYVVQIVPYVKGHVLKIHAQANQPVRKGDLLLEINPVPFQYTVNQTEAQLEVARQSVEQAQAGLEAARANVLKSKAGVTQTQGALAQARASLAGARAALVKTKAQDALAVTEQKIARTAGKMDPGAISDLTLAKTQQNRQATDAAVNQADAGVQQALAAVDEARAGLAGAKAALQQTEAAERQAALAVQVARSNVKVVEAQRDTARFNLAQCRVLAPADGYLVNWQVQEGTMMVTAPAGAAGTFVCTAETAVVASFPQNHLMNVQRGDEVEVILAPYPGQLFKGKVDAVIPATGEGQFAPSGTIPQASKVGSEGKLAVKVLLTDEAAPANLPLGAAGEVAIYTDRGKPVHIISKVALRMKKWLLYVVPSK